LLEQLKYRVTFTNHSPAHWILLVGLVCLTGCKSADEAKSGHMASVMISGHTKKEIQTATTTAFLASGFSKKEALTFEKEGSAWDTANYGGWADGRVWIKVRAEIIFVETNQFKLGCDVYAVQGHGDLGTEMEHKYVFAKKSECKKILDEAKAALGARSSGSDTLRPLNP
jgi:hypothetical protein